MHEAIAPLLGEPATRQTAVFSLFSALASQVVFRGFLRCGVVVTGATLAPALALLLVERAIGVI